MQRHSVQFALLNAPYAGCFQVDYRPAAGAPAAAANPLKVRGEWTTNAGPVYAANLAAYNQAVPVAPNPSVADSQALQASLVAKVGA